MDKLLKIAESFHNATTNSQFEIWKGRELNKKHLINTLNYINFQDGTILINFNHLKNEKILSLKARPLPCLDDSLDCLWVETTGVNKKLKSYEFMHFLITDGQKIILVKPDLIRIGEAGISFNLPETCHELYSRKARRYVCEGINVEFVQSGVIFHGYLLDFNAFSFRVEIFAVPPLTFQWINPEAAATVIFKDGQDILYSGECKIIRQNSDQLKRTYVLEPLNNQARRLKPKEYRSTRHELLPSPHIIFKHPLTKNLISLEVEDLSGSGFSVEENYDNSVLLPGMVIPHVEIEFANTFKINCKAQVVYRNLYLNEDDKIHVKCGNAILDMDIQSQVILSSLLQHVKNKKSYVCSRVDLDDLWKFFFEAGFIYPKKYALMHTDKEKFKETYEKLYMQNPHIARHFIYQDKGIIKGHISMVRFYENTWIFHHHASKPSTRAGFVVLDQIGSYVNDFYCLYSAHMNFIACYFRPDNRFPHRVFGDFTRSLNEPKGCSLDPFAYFHFPKSFGHFDSQRLTDEEAGLDEAQPEDLLELHGFYEHTSGGLMLDALDLAPHMIDNDTLNREYEKIGFKRERHLFSLKKEGALKAIIMVNVSDIGLNLSNLTNCINVFVLDVLPQNMLYTALSKLTKYYEQDEVFILLYPVSYAEDQFIPFDKVYDLWVISPQRTDAFLKHIDKLTKHKP